MVGRDTELIPLAVADDVLLRQTELLAEISAKLNCFLVYGRKISGVGKPALAYLETNITVVCLTSGVPAPVIPRERLVCGDTAVSEFPDECVDTDTNSSRKARIPVVPANVCAIYGG